MTENFGN
jgi:hypothetical protein